MSVPAASLDREWRLRQRIDRLIDEKDSLQTRLRRVQTLNSKHRENARTWRRRAELWQARYARGSK